MTTYCYSVYDSENQVFSPLQSHVNDDIASFEIIRCFLASLPGPGEEAILADMSVNPLQWNNDHFHLNPRFFKRFEVYRLGIFDDSTGLLDGSVERVSIFDKVQDAAKKYAVYFNGLPYFQKLADAYQKNDKEVNDDES